MAPLNHKQKKFALEYRVDGNGTQAVIRAGYSHRGAGDTASRLLANPAIRKLIDAANEKVLAKVEATGNRVLEELALIGYFDPLGVFIDDPDRDDNGTLRALKAMPPEVRRNIKSLKFTELFEGGSGEQFVSGRIVDITFWDKVKSLDLLGKNQGLFAERHIHEAGPGLAELLAEAYKKGES